MPDRRPRPTVDPLSSAYWHGAAEGRLLIQRCSSCERAQFYPRQRCKECGGAVEWVTSSGRGIVHSFSIIRQHATPPFRDMVPYVLAIVELEEDVRMMANVTHCEPDAVEIGLAVEVYMDVLDAELGVPLFRPRLEPNLTGESA